MKANVSALRLATGLGPTLAVALASCAPPPTQVPPPPPAPVVVQPVRPKAPVPQPPQPSDWRDAGATPGDWRWSNEGTTSVARFAGPNGVLFAMSCNLASHTMTLSRFTASAGTGPMPFGITTTTARRVLDGVVAPDGSSVSVSLPAADSLLDAMAFSRGRFMVELPGAAPRYLPSWAEVSRVTEDCR